MCEQLANHARGAPAIITGDFNVEVEELPTTATLLNTGWHRLHDPQQPTCITPLSTSSMDAVIANPAALRRISTPKIHDDDYTLNPHHALSWTYHLGRLQVPRLHLPRRLPLPERTHNPTPTATTTHSTTHDHDYRHHYHDQYHKQHTQRLLP